MDKQKSKMLSICYIVLVCLYGGNSLAKEHYVNPETGSNPSSDGSQNAPWSNLQKLFDDNEIRAGDKVILLPGKYGQLFIRNKKYSRAVTVVAQTMHSAKFGNLKVWGSQNIYFKGLTISPSFLPEYRLGNIVEISEGSENIEIEEFDIYSTLDSTGWSKADWNKRSANGIFTKGSRIDLINNELRNVNYGISVVSEYSKVIGNLVENFSGDGLRAHGDHTVFEGNTVKNCFQVNDNHADGFQSWSVGKDGKVGTGAVRGVILRRNLIINFEDPNQPFRCKMQGIGMFDGMFIDWVIENNIIVTDHWHGITVLGGKNVRIVNNTVVDAAHGRPGPPWIKVDNHKNGTPSSGNLIANNLASNYSDRKKGVLHLNNQIIRNEAALFANPKKFDFRLQEGSRAIDAGMLGLRVIEDFYGNPRPVGAGIDVGAIEKQ